MANRKDPMAMYDTGELLSSSSRRSSIINRISSASAAAAGTAADTGKELFSKTLGNNAPELVQSHKDAASLMLGGPIGSMFAKSIAKQTSQTLTNALNRFKGSYKDNYMEASVNSGGDGGNTYSSQQPSQPQHTEPNEIDEIFKNDDGSTTKRKTKIRQTGKKKRIEYKETISNKRQDNTLISKRGASTNASRNQGFSSLDKNYVNSIINKKFDEKSELPGESLTRKDLAFITHLSKSIVSKMERSAEAKKDNGILKGLGETIISAFPSIRMINAAKYYHQLPNPAKVGVFNAMNTSIGMLYASSRSIGTETHRLLYSLIQVNKIGMGVKLKVKAPTDITTLTEFLGSTIKNVVKSPFTAGRWALTGALGLGGISSGPNLGGMSGRGGGGGRNLRSGKGLGLSLAALLGMGGIGATGAGLMGSGPMAGMMANSISPQHLALIQKLMMGAGGGLKGLGGAAMAGTSAAGIPLAPLGMALAGYAGYRALGGMARSLRTGALKNTWVGKGYQNSTIGRIHGAASKAKNFIFTNGKDNDEEESEKGNLYSKKILNNMEIDSKRDSKYQDSNIYLLRKLAKVSKQQLETSMKSADEDKKANKATDRWRLFQMISSMASGLLGMAGGLTGIATSGVTVATIGVIGKAIFDWMSGGSGLTTLKESGIGAVVGGLIGAGVGAYLAGPKGAYVGGKFGLAIGAGFMAFVMPEIKTWWQNTTGIKPKSQDPTDGTRPYQNLLDDIKNGTYDPNKDYNAKYPNAIDAMVAGNYSPFNRYIQDPALIKNSRINNSDKRFGFVWDAPRNILPDGPIRSKEQMDELLYGMPPLNTGENSPLDVEMSSTYTPPKSPTVKPSRSVTSSSPYAGLPPMVTTQIPNSSLNPTVTPTPQAAPTTVAPAPPKMSLEQKIDSVSKQVGGSPPNSFVKGIMKDRLQEAIDNKWSRAQVDAQASTIISHVGGKDTPENRKIVTDAIMTEINPSSGVAPQASTKSGLTGNSGLDMVLPNLAMAAPRTMSTMGTASKYDLNGYFQNVPDQYKPFVLEASEKFGVDPNMIAAIMRTESNFNPKAGSSAGARGLMQMMPDASKDVGLNWGDAFDPRKNIMAGTEYFSRKLKETGGNVQLALAAYNAGFGNVKKFGMQIPPFEETQDYVPKVLGFFGNTSPGTMSTSSSASSTSPSSPSSPSLWESGTAIGSALWNDPSTYPEKEVSTFLTDLGAQAKAYGSSALDYIDSRIPSIPQTSAKPTSSKEWRRQHSLAYWNIQDQASSKPLNKSEIRRKIEEYAIRNPELKEKIEKETGLTIEQLLDSEMDSKELSSLLTGNQLSGTLKNISDVNGVNGSMVDPGHNKLAASVNNLISTLSTNSSNSNVSNGGGNALQDFETDRLPFDLQSLLFGDFD
jgi:hypothetical protein